MTEPCLACDGSGIEDQSEENWPCSVCRRVVSVEDAGIAAAVKEIERLRLDAHYTVHDREGMPRLWQVHKWNARGLPGEGFVLPMGEGPTLPAALEAYREAAKGKP